MINGFFGGKFMPLHKGHLYCIDTAAKMCDRVVVVMFINSEDEFRISQESVSPLWSVENRIKQLERVCKLYPNVEFHIIDDNFCKKPDGTTDWDMETPLVRQWVPVMDFVYSSELSYDAYFKRAYPEAKHIIVDEKREHYPISGTLIRAMNILEEQEKWLV